MAWTPDPSPSSVLTANYVMTVTDSDGKLVWQINSFMNWDDASIQQVFTCLKQIPLVTNNNLSVSIQKFETTTSNSTSSWS